MTPTSPNAPERLTDGSTWYWSRIFPTLWSVLLGVFVVLVWMGVLGDAAEPMAVKAGITAAWAVASAVFFRMFAGLKDVWLDGDDLLVGDPARGTRISLRDVREVRESRLRQVKSITLELGRPTPWGDSITFVPKGLKTFLFPYASSPVAGRLRESKERLLTPG
ncbi:MAG TPA: hypothetical protein VLH75_09935 [Longimicrobiales bacterium]|nr:hypothetical protein [Longimicrobiales bacterium]